MSTLGFVVAFVLIMYLSVKRVSIARVMFFATAIVAATCGKDFASVISTVKTAFIDRATLELAAAVLAIGVFSTFMREFGFLQKTVIGLTTFLGNAKAAIISVPALIGSMPVLGGAALSAPLVDKLGDSLGLEADVKAAANLAFRHGTLFIVPFSSNLILASKLTGFSISTLISYLWPMSIAIWGIGYFVLLRTRSGGREAISQSAAAAERAGEAAPGRFWGFGQFVLYGGPLLMALVVGLVFSLPLWISLAIGTSYAIVLGLYQKKGLPSIKTVYAGANLTQVIAMFWIMAFKEFVVDSPVFPALISKASAAGISKVMISVLIPLAFGFGSASQTTTLGVLIPLLVPASGAELGRLYLTCLIYVSSFTAYFFSPLHMCQVLTCDYFKIDMSKVYRRNWPLLIGFFAVMAVFYFLAARVS